MIEPEAVPGYRLNPMDYELILHYLLPKLKKECQNCSYVDTIPDADVYRQEPDCLTAMYEPQGKNKYYFFTGRRQQHKNGSRPSRAAGGGYWHASTGDKKILHKGKVIGWKKQLTFYLGRKDKKKTSWIMYEYTAGMDVDRKLTKGFDEVVLCSIHNKETQTESPSPSPWVNAMTTMPPPPGCRFDPWDYELILHHLMRRVDNDIVYAGISRIPVVDVYHQEPEILTALHKPQGLNKYYFFTRRTRQHKNGSRPSRVAGGGYWKAATGSTEIYHQKSLIGLKKQLTFCPSRGDKKTMSSWIMYEYTLANDLNISGFEDLVLCSIHNAKSTSFSQAEDPSPVSPALPQPLLPISSQLQQPQSNESDETPFLDGILEDFSPQDFWKGIEELPPLLTWDDRGPQLPSSADSIDHGPQSDFDCFTLEEYFKD